MAEDQWDGTEEPMWEKTARMRLWNRERLRTNHAAWVFKTMSGRDCRRVSVATLKATKAANAGNWRACVGWLMRAAWEAGYHAREKEETDG